MADRAPTEAENEKALAEAEKARAEAQAVLLEAQANAEKAKAEAAQARAETRAATAQAEEAELRLVKARNDRDREREKREEELADHRHHHVYLFDKTVSEGSVRDCVRQLTTWTRTSTGPVTVELVIDSPGGSVFDGFHLIDYINRLHAEGHTINTTAYGMAASMAGVILQAGKTRAMGANAGLLIHEASFMAFGSFGNVVDEVEMVKKMQDRILDLFASRARAAKGAKAMTKQQLKRRWHRKDWWLLASEAERYGFVDEVR